MLAFPCNLARAKKQAGETKTNVKRTNEISAGTHQSCPEVEKQRLMLGRSGGRRREEKFAIPGAKTIDGGATFSANIVACILPFPWNN